MVEEEVGVGALEPDGDRLSPWEVVEEDSGEAVPDGLSFFLEDFPESLALESCSCWLSVNFKVNTTRGRDTYHSRTEALHLVFLM